MSAFLFYAVIISFFCGTGVRSLYVVPYEWLVVLLFSSLLLGVVWARKRSFRALACSLVLLFCTLGIVRFDITSWSPTEQFLDSYSVPVEIVGVVSREPDRRENTTHVFLRIETVVGQKFSDTILVYADRNISVVYGDKLRVIGELSRPESFTTDLGRTFNYPEYLRAKGVSHVVFYPDIEIVSSGHGNVFFSAILQFKHHFMDSVESVMPEPAVGLGEGLLLGVQSGLGERYEQIFRRTGIIHIVVLSGYNIMLVVTFVMTVLSYILGKRLRLIFGIAAIISFALMVGLSATVVRASVMAGLLLFAQATGRTYAVTRALFAAGLVMILINPQLLLFDPGFQLSFLATLGLILLAAHLESRLTWVPNVIGIRSFLVATLATQIFVLPFLLYQIGEVSVVSVLVNVLVLPMVPVAMLLTFITGMVAFVHVGLATLVGFLAYLSLEYILRMATAFSLLPFASYAVPAFPWWVMGLGYMFIGYLTWRLYQPRESEINTDELKGWTIEEETEEGPALRAGPQDLPVFFR